MREAFAFEGPPPLRWRRDVSVLLLPALSYVVLTMCGLVAGCDSRDGQSLRGELHPVSVPVAVWPGQSLEVALVQAVWDGNRRVALRSSGAFPKDREVVPLVCWGYVDINIQQGSNQLLRLPTIDGLYRSRGIQQIGIQERESGSPKWRSKHWVSVCPLKRADTEKAGQDVVLEICPIALTPGCSEHDTVVELPGFLAQKRLHGVLGRQVKPLFVSLMANPFKDACVPGPWFDGDVPRLEEPERYTELRPSSVPPE